ncbi:hypothetical protein J8L86_11445 [Shewanella sp. MMG014]|uniref:hypothetical protein n=1 Tax=Shewanella sp. MMG014 TaxID=2822691 RepID=UPI001B3635F3|nr:hypothetical protein [Shewanella sp. MMG014]MBQ4890463.1 hypothetical protein [Shewanella sp. MMG014]
MISYFKRLIVLGGLFSCSLQALVFDHNHKYISVDILPLCTDNGQIILEYTNTSDQDLLVDPRFLDSELFDAHNAGISIGYYDGESIRTKRLKPEHYYGSNWFPLSVGQSVRHEIDLRDYAEDSIDYGQLVYPVYSGANIKIITVDEGQEVYLTVNTYDDYENDAIEPECFLVK